MAIDTNLIAAIRNDKYDAWANSPTPSRVGITTDHDNHLPKYKDDRLDYVRISGNGDGWRRIVSWDLGKLRDPSAIVILKWRMIETGRDRVNRTDFDSGRQSSYCRENYMTPVYQVIGANEYKEDYTDTIARLRRMQENSRLENCTLIFDATGVGVAVEEQLRHLSGFDQVIGMTITGGDTMKAKGMFTSAGKSRLLSDTEQVINQKRIRTPENNPDFQKLRNQITGLQVEETIQGYYRTVDDRSSGHHSDLLMALAMGVAWGEYQAAKYRRLIAV